MPTSSALLIDAKQGHRRGGAKRSWRRLAEVAAAEGADPQQGRSGREADAAGAGASAPTSGEVRRDLHGLGADAATASPICKHWLAAHVPRGPVALSGGPDLRRAAAPARGRDHAREALSSGCTRNCRTSRRSRPSWKERATARCGSSRRSMWSAKASARSCSARAARPSRRSAQTARKEIAEIARSAGAPVPVREGARGLGRRSRSATAQWAWNFRRSEVHRCPQCMGLTGDSLTQSP